MGACTEARKRMRGARRVGDRDPGGEARASAETEQPRGRSVLRRRTDAWHRSGRATARRAAMAARSASSAAPRAAPAGRAARRSASGSAGGRRARPPTRAPGWPPCPVPEPSASARWAGDAITARARPAPTRMSGAADGGGTARGERAARRSSRRRLNGWWAASERRPSSRMVGGWWSGSAATAALRSPAGTASRAQRAPGRQPPPRGTEQAPGSSSTGSKASGRGSGGARGPLPAAAARSGAAAGRARRPWHRRPPDQREKGLPPRWRASSTDQRARPTPGAPSGAEGAQPIRQRVAAADGSARGSAPCAPAPQQQRRRLAVVRRELEPARRGHVGAHLADHGGEPAMAKRILHHRQDVLVLAGLGKEDPPGGRPACSRPGRVEVEPGQRPQDARPLPASRKRRRCPAKERRGGVVA